MSKLKKTTLNELQKIMLNDLLLKKSMEDLFKTLTAGYGKPSELVMSTSTFESLESTLQSITYSPDGIKVYKTSKNEKS